MCHSDYNFTHRFKIPYLDFIVAVNSLHFGCAQALQQFDQRSSGFKLSGISELLNRLANNGLAIVGGLLSLGGPCLILAVGVGQATKILVIQTTFQASSRFIFSRYPHGYYCS